MPSLRAIELKAFVPAKDFARSKQFYVDVGFTMASEGGGIAYFHRDGAAFLLQDFYDPDLAKGLTMHFLVEDVEAWRQAILGAGIPNKYGVEVTEIVQQPWRMRDFSFTDPSGVEWTVAQNTA